jgi:hypothetical protein
MCLIIVHHQRSDLIIVILPWKYISLLHSSKTTLESVDLKVCTWLLKVRARPPQALNDWVFYYLIIIVQLEGWKKDKDEGPPWLVAHK